MAIKTISLENLTRAFHKAEKIFLKIKDAVKSVNGNLPDALGDITVDRVNYAGDLESSSSQGSTGAFIVRTTGGSQSVGTGSAWLGSVLGESVHTGYVPESVVMTLETSGLDATIDEDDFKTAAGNPGTMVFGYGSSGWNTDPENYGITLIGEPQQSDTITVVWTAEARGAITPATPTAFVATGWNLYNHSEGYARVTRYSDEYGYKIAGAYTKVEFSETETGTKTTITPTGGAFNVPSDGYVWVTGGNSTTTEVWPTWGDWTETPNSGVFSAYTETAVSLASVMAQYFPYGLCRVGTVRDEINLSLGSVVIRIERMEYTEENRAAVEASGRDWDADVNYIYIVKAQADTRSVVLDGSFDANDHGTELFLGTTVAPVASTIYGENLKNKLERDVLTISQQTLTSAQKAQVLANIGAAPYPFKHLEPSSTSASLTVTNNDSYAIGNLVVVNMKISITANINKNWVLVGMPATINNGGLVSNNFHSRVLCTDGTNSFTPYSLFLLTRGDIYTTEALTSGTNLFLSVVYIADPESVATF